MADSKITALTSIGASTDPANDPLVLVDVSDTSMAATGTTKKVTLNQLLGASGTATLASATITGDLTVDTSTLKVDSANNRVGVGTASPTEALEVSNGGNIKIGGFDQCILGAGGGGAKMQFSNGASDLDLFGGSTGRVRLYTASTERYRIASDGIATWSNVGGVAGTAMTLNSTGLGVGGSVLAKISAYLTSTATYNSAAAGDDTDFQISRVNNSTVSGQSSTIALNSSSDNGANVARVYLACVQESNASYASAFTVKTRNSAGTNSERLRIDSSGNVGIGVTPKSWLSSYKAIQLGYSTSLSSTTGTDFAGLSSNAYVDSVDSRWERIVSGYATQYYQNAGDGQHIWRIAGTAAADTAITWTNAMTLDASGNLGIGVTPSAWGSTYRALQIGLGTSLTGVTNDVDVNLVNNARFDGTNWKYTNSSPAERYRAASGTHYWYNAASGTAGNNITWTQAMTLDASGNLLVGKTATNYLTVGCEVKPNGAFQSTQSGSTNANTCWDTYSTGAGAYRFYVGMAGTVFATNTTISAISDARFKENVQDIDVGLGAILALKPRKFDWKDGKGKNIKGDRGFIAQEFETVFPNLIDEWKENAPEGEAPYKSVRQDLIPVLVKAIQELAAEVNALKNA